MIASVLAAGHSRRMGRDKLALAFRGRTVIWHSVAATLQSSASRIVVVTGAASNYPLPDDSRIEQITNSRHLVGMGTSLSVAAAAMSERDTALLVTLGDKPLLRPETIIEAIERFEASGASLLVTFHDGEPGHPVIFSRELVPSLLALDGDEGARRIIATHDAVERLDSPDEGVSFDIDTTEDYTRLLGMHNGH